MAIFDGTTYFPIQKAGYFLDCNILMYISYTNGSYNQKIVSDYASLVSRIINVGAKIYISDVLISEFINTYIRTEFHRLAKINNWGSDKNYFKHQFRQTQEYIDTLKEIRLIINKQLLPISVRFNSDFVNCNLDYIFNPPAAFDFNDRYYASQAIERNMFIVTHDADFSNINDCNIITINQKLLAPAQQN